MRNRHVNPVRLVTKAPMQDIKEAKVVVTADMRGAVERGIHDAATAARFVLVQRGKLDKIGELTPAFLQGRIVNGQLRLLTGEKPSEIKKDFLTELVPSIGRVNVIRGSEADALHNFGPINHNFTK